jgi:hypothetical protein
VCPRIEAELLRRYWHYAGRIKVLTSENLPLLCFTSAR